MLESISWAEYISAVFILLVIYYGLVIYRFFGFEFLLLFAARENEKPSAQLSLFDERLQRDEISTHPDGFGRAAVSPDEQQTLLLSDTDKLFQNLSFFSPGEKEILLGSLSDLLKRYNYDPRQDCDQQHTSREIIRLASSYCEVCITQDDIESVIKKSIEQN